MSIKAMCWAYDQVVGSSPAKFVLVKLADNSDDDGLCWPSIANICAHTELARSTVKECLKRLAECGKIEIIHRKTDTANLTNYYRLKMGQSDRLGRPPPDGYGRLSPEGGPPVDRGVGRTATPEPSLEPSEEPSLREEKKAPGGALSLSPDKSIGSEIGLQLRERNSKKSAQLPLGAISPPVVYPDWLPMDLWKAFKAERAAKGCPMSDNAESLNLKKLAKLKDAGDDPAEVIEQAIMNGWRGLFALRKDFKTEREEIRPGENGAWRQTTEEDWMPEIPPEKKISLVDAWNRSLMDKKS